MSKKEAGIIGLIGAGILGLGLLFGLGGKKSSNDNVIPGGGSGGGLDGYGYNNPIIGGSSAGGGIGSADATKPGTPYVIVNPPIVYGGGSSPAPIGGDEAGGADIVSEAPNPDFNKNNIDGADNTPYGQNSTPEGWRIKEISSPKGGFKVINDITGKQIWTSQTPEEFIEDTSDPDSKYYDPQTSAGVASALKLYENAPVKTTESSGNNPPTQTYNNAAEEITHILYDSAPVSSSGSTGNIATSESTPTPAHAEPEHRNINDYRRGKRRL